ncbi:MAG: glycosyl hydrolase [Candidatus Sumerlaeota bacterium]|nr:glycosyl hydrolase [Candidatus Sumerlaeota bacterium]
MYYTMKNLLSICLSMLCLGLIASAASTDSLEAGFGNPPESAKPWVYWFWINGNVSKEGITADLEALKYAGVGGVIWMEVGGGQWAPDGNVTPLSSQWHDCMQWAVRECARLGMEFDISVDFGYGSGGPHITPELSMQKLVWSEKIIEGGRTLSVTLDKPGVSSKALPRSKAKVSEAVLDQIERSDFYKDVAVIAVPLPESPEAQAYRIADLQMKNGLSGSLHRGRESAQEPPVDAVTPNEQVFDLTGKMDRDGHLTWGPPPGRWLVIRFGHVSNLKMTRPCPPMAVGLECDRLAPAGIETHYDAFLKKIFAEAGAEAGKTLDYVHIDSWEAGGQNWTETFPAEFLKRRGYDLRPWLPVMTGRVVGSAELAERFLWDVRATVGEMIRDNYANRLRELARQHGIQLSIEAYGRLCIDDLSYAGIGDMPMSEFWAMGNSAFPAPGNWEISTKAMASAAHTYGKPVVGAESFTSGRGWRDHPFLLKGMGDRAFCRGVNRMVFHCSAHQPYENMVPGLTHRRWGEHFQRFNTWWDYSRVWTDYLSRCQYLLQQGEFVADVCYWFGEGAPLSVNDMKASIPAGYDYDLCSSELVLQMRVRDGRLVLPSRMNYRYLLLPETDRMTLPLARKIRELIDDGARVIGGTPPIGSPSLADYPRGDEEIEETVAELWGSNRVISGADLGEIFRRDGLKPDFEGAGLSYIHRRIGESDVYFVSYQQNQTQDISCAFRVTGKAPELWDPETGAIRDLPEFTEKEGRITASLHFDPMQSWFVIFRKPSAGVDPIVRVTRDGQPLQTGVEQARIEVKQARYGVLDDPKRTRDVRAKVQAQVDAGVTRFNVSELAKGDDPARGVVKTLVIDYTVGGKAFTVTSRDRETVTLNVPSVEVAPAVDLNRGDILQSGAYSFQTASGRQWQQAVSLPAPQEIPGPWEMRFDPKWGGPATPVTLEALEDWSKRPEPGIRYYSGTAKYRTAFPLNSQPSTRNRLHLDLGQVEVMARVILNGKDCGIAWKPPYVVDITGAVHAKDNELEIDVVNLWINRMIGDENLPEDCNWLNSETLAEWPDWFKAGTPRPSERYTFTTCKHYDKDSPLVSSGLLGPVTLRTAEIIPAK